MIGFLVISILLTSYDQFVQSATLNNLVPISWVLAEGIIGIQESPIDCVGGILRIENQSPLFCSSCFGVNPQGPALFYAARNGQQLDFDQANIYIFNMSCTVGTAVTYGEVTLQIAPNFPPRFRNTATTHSINPNTGTGGGVLDLRPLDPETQQLTYTITESPDNGFFDINGAGFIIAKKPLKTFCKSETVTVTMEDNFNPPVSRTITMNPGSNTKPILKDWNRIIRLPENSNLNIPNTDNLNSQTCVFTVEPAQYASFLDTTSCPSPTLRSTAGNTFNYEVDPPINVSFVYDNGFCPADPRWLYIEWTDEPEPPVLTLDKPDFVTNEGFIDIRPAYTIVDDDNPDKHTYSFVDPTLYPDFQIDPDTGKIYTPNYYEMDCVRDRRGFIFEVQVTDDRAQVVSDPPVQVKLNLTDVNDNRPYFTRPFDPTPVLYADCINPFTLTDLAPDVDDDDCNQITNGYVEFVPAISGSLALSKDGIVRLTKPPIAGQVDILTIQAIDRGQPPLLSEPETISIRGFPCPTVAPVVPAPVPVVPATTGNGNTGSTGGTGGTGGTVTTTEAGFFDNPWNIALIALAGLLGLALLGLLGYLLYRFCGPFCSNACYKCRNPPLKPNKIKPGKLSGDGKGSGAEKGGESGVNENEGDVVEANKGTMAGGKIIRYGGYVDEYGYSQSTGGGGYGYGGGGGGYGDGYGGGEGVVVGDSQGGRVDDSYWKEHYMDKDFTSHPSRNALPAAVDK